MMLIYAHRGSSARFPENTLPAFHQALVAGADGIELDVRATADGIPVVIHDRSVARTTNGVGYVDEMTLARLQAFDAGRGEHVPALDAVLALVETKARLDVEIKGSGIEREVLAVLGNHPAVRWAISSFDWETLRAVRRFDPAAELWPLAEQFGDELLQIAAELDAPAVSLASGAFTTSAASALRAAGLRSVLWTVNGLDEARRVRDLGAHALCTDVPEQLIAGIGRA